MGTPLICIADSTSGTSINILLGNPPDELESHVHKRMAVYFITHYDNAQVSLVPLPQMARHSEDSLGN